MIPRYHAKVNTFFQNFFTIGETVKNFVLKPRFLYNNTVKQYLPFKSPGGTVYFIYFGCTRQSLLFALSRNLVYFCGYHGRVAEILFRDNIEAVVKFID